MVARQATVMDETPWRHYQCSPHDTAVRDAYTQVSSDDPALEDVTEHGIPSRSVAMDDPDHGLTGVHQNVSASMEQLNFISSCDRLGNGQIVSGEYIPGAFLQNSYLGYFEDGPWTIMQPRRTGRIVPMSGLMDVERTMNPTSIMTEGGAFVPVSQAFQTAVMDDYPVHDPVPSSGPSGEAFFTTLPMTLQQEYVNRLGSRTITGLDQEVLSGPQIQATMSATFVYGIPITYKTTHSY